jgi:hypothetical protein
MSNANESIGSTRSTDGKSIGGHFVPRLGVRPGVEWCGTDLDGGAALRTISTEVPGEIGRTRSSLVGVGSSEPDRLDWSLIVAAFGVAGTRGGANPPVISPNRRGLLPCEIDCCSCVKTTDENETLPASWSAGVMGVTFPCEIIVGFVFLDGDIGDISDAARIDAEREAERAFPAMLFAAAPEGKLGPAQSNAAQRGTESTSHRNSVAPYPCAKPSLCAVR